MSRWRPTQTSSQHSAEDLGKHVHRRAPGVCAHSSDLALQLSSSPPVAVRSDASTLPFRYLEQTGTGAHNASGPCLPA
jgi:hypothetical protein